MWVAVVFSGGGARGIAQVGVLKALVRHAIPIDLIAAMQAWAPWWRPLRPRWWTPAEIDSLTTSIDWEEATSLSDATARTRTLRRPTAGGGTELPHRQVRRSGRRSSPVDLARQKLTTLLHSLALQSDLPSRSVIRRDLRIPFRAVATDLISGVRIVMKDGSLAEALRASLTVPLLFSPIERDSLRLVDGGLVNNIPVDVVQEEGRDLDDRRELHERFPHGGGDKGLGSSGPDYGDHDAAGQGPDARPRRRRDHSGSARPSLRQISGRLIHSSRGEKSAEAAIPAIRQLYEERKFRFPMIDGSFPIGGSPGLRSRSQDPLPTAPRAYRRRGGVPSRDFSGCAGAREYPVRDRRLQRRGGGDRPRGWPFPDHLQPGRGIPSSDSWRCDSLCKDPRRHGPATVSTPSSDVRLIPRHGRGSGGERPPALSPEGVFSPHGPIRPARPGEWHPPRSIPRGAGSSEIRTRGRATRDSYIRAEFQVLKKVVGVFVLTLAIRN
ncbi:MAG: patatin-like phospholipase family protein [Ignavibacteriales bacterium]|nr:patatin-like phospholipase family protein [Ignavibacteriales bacterium]